MKEITISANDAGRRLDRFLRKYLPGAPLGEVYKIIRKYAKVSGRRRNESYILQEGDVLNLYMSDAQFEKYRTSHKKTSSAARRSFGIIYEDDDVLIVNKPWGLLTHGDSHEKKNHLANQVKDYLIAEGSYDPGSEKVFSPAPANRLDRNTSGIVFFGKTSAAARELARMIRQGLVSKFYMTIASGTIDHEIRLGGTLTKDEQSNKVTVHDSEDETADGSKEIATVIRPLKALRIDGRFNATLVEAELITGRTHQIRAHLAHAGHPILGDSKYASKGVRDLNKYANDALGISTQLLHASRIEFGCSDVLPGISGRTFKAELSQRFKDAIERIGE